MNASYTSHYPNETSTHSVSWAPQFQLNAEKATAQLSGILSVYIVGIFIFVLIKTTCSHGLRIWLFYNPGNTKFPKRPEIFVILFSTIPTMLTTLSRSVCVNYYKWYINIGYKWPSCQIVLFFDIFSRTSALYHMMYWTCARYINPLLWKCYKKFLLWRNHDVNEGTEKIFKMHCKRRIPCLIYLASFFATMPILILAEKSYDDGKYVCAKIWVYEFYHYYDNVCLISLPLLLMIVRFYISALNKDRGKRMIYRLRCYHVTFILLTIPIFVLNIVYEIFKTYNNQDLTSERFGNGILISVTAYHTTFIIKPLVYTTGCNCICCGDRCLLNNPRLNRWVIYWSVPQHKEEKNPYSQPIQVTID